MDSLFERMGDAHRAHARATDPETSHEAAEAISPHLASIRERVESWARSRGPGGFIDEELSAAFADAEHSSYRTRRAELAADRLILDTGKRRQNSGGHNCIVWAHRDHIVNPSPLPECASAKLSAAERRHEAHAMAGKFRSFARQMRSEGRAMFADELDRGADLFAQLATRP